MLGRYLLKKYLLICFIGVILFGWAGTASVLLLRKTDKTLVIGVDQNGSRILSEKEDPLFKTEVVNFVRRFFGLLYNFDTESFQSNVGAASDLMALDLWKTQEPLILRLSEKIKSENISHTGIVKSISKVSDGHYVVLLKTSEMHRMTNTDRNLSVKLSIRSVPRTEANPWGMEVTSLEESKI